MRSSSRGFARALFAGLWLLALPVQASAQARPEGARADARLRFDIPPGPLSRAIEAYALATDVQVLYDRPSGEAQRSPGVTGLHTREAALAALLRGTGLRAEISADGSVVLRPEGPVAAPGVIGRGPPPPDLGAALSLDTLEVRGVAMIPAGEGERLDLRLYGGLVQGAVRQALAGDPATVGGRYKVTLKLWIDHGGAIERLEAVDASGDPRSDQAVVEVVRRVVVSPPPPEGLPQPVVLVVRSRPGA